MEEVTASAVEVLEPVAKSGKGKIILLAGLGLGLGALATVWIVKKVKAARSGSQEATTEAVEVTEVE